MKPHETNHDNRVRVRPLPTMIQTALSDFSYPESTDYNIRDEIDATVTRLKAVINQEASLRKALRALFVKRREEAIEQVRMANRYLDLVNEEETSFCKDLKQAMTIANECSVSATSVTTHETDTKATLIPVLTGTPNDDALLSKLHTCNHQPPHSPEMPTFGLVEVGQGDIKRHCFDEPPKSPARPTNVFGTLISSGRSARELDDTHSLYAPGHSQRTLERTQAYRPADSFGDKPGPSIEVPEKAPAGRASAFPTAVKFGASDFGITPMANTSSTSGVITLQNKSVAVASEYQPPSTSVGAGAVSLGATMFGFGTSQAPSTVKSIPHSSHTIFNTPPFFLVPPMEAPAAAEDPGDGDEVFDTTNEDTESKWGFGEDAHEASEYYAAMERRMAEEDRVVEELQRMRAELDEQDQLEEDRLIAEAAEFELERQQDEMERQRLEKEERLEREAIEAEMHLLAQEALQRMEELEGQRQAEIEHEEMVERQRHESRLMFEAVAEVRRRMIMAREEEEERDLRAHRALQEETVKAQERLALVEAELNAVEARRTEMIRQKAPV